MESKWEECLAGQHYANEERRRVTNTLHAIEKGSLKLFEYRQSHDTKDGCTVIEESTSEMRKDSCEDNAGKH